MKRVILYTVTVLCLLSVGQISAQISPTTIDASIALKIPGNDAIHYPLEGSTGEQSSQLKADKDIPVVVIRTIKENRIEVMISAKEDIYFNFKQRINTSYSHDDCQFYMPGFWYRRNLRSPKEAPSFHTSDSWTVREDRLSEIGRAHV